MSIPENTPREEDSRIEADSDNADSDVVLGELSRNPSDYAPTDHFLIRARRSFGPITETRTSPSITVDVIETCFKEGEIKRARDGCVKFMAEVNGVEWHLVAHEGRALTAYAPDHHSEEIVEGDA